MNSFSIFVGLIAALFSIAVAVLTFVEKSGITKKALAIIVTVLVVIIGAGVFFATSTSIVVHTPRLPIIANEGSFLTAIPSPTLSPTPTPRIIYENLDIPCTDCTNSRVQSIAIHLERIVVDTLQYKVNFYVALTNISNTDDEENFSIVRLQNSNDGSITDGLGQADTNAGWQLGPNNSLDKIITFPIIPKSGIKYRLIISIGVGSAIDRTYQDEIFTF